MDAPAHKNESDRIHSPRTGIYTNSEAITQISPTMSYTKQANQPTKKILHGDAVKAIQETMNMQHEPSVALDTVNVANIKPLAPTPMSALPIGQPIPPEVDNIETEDDGFYVDEKDLIMAQSRVKRWLELDAEISTLNTAIRDRRRQKDDLNKHIIAFMQGNQVPHFEMSQGNLSLEVTKHRQPLSQKWVATQIQSVEGLNQSTQDALMKVIFEDRVVTEKHRLKHKKGKSVTL